VEEVPFWGYYQQCSMHSQITWAVFYQKSNGRKKHKAITYFVESPAGSLLVSF
jgi:hypothetical protein